MGALTACSLVNGEICLRNNVVASHFRLSKPCLHAPCKFLPHRAGALSLNNNPLRSGYRQTRQTSRKEHAQAVVSSSAVISASSAPVPLQKEFKWGANMQSLGIAVAVGVITWFVPPPAGGDPCLQAAQITELSLPAKRGLLAVRESQKAMRSNSAPCLPSVSPSPGHFFSALVLPEDKLRRAGLRQNTLDILCRRDSTGMASAGNISVHNCWHHHTATTVGGCGHAWPRSNHADQGALFWSGIQCLLQRNPVSLPHS